MSWRRVRAGDKLAFHQDMQSDPTLTDLQKRMISTIATHWDNGRMSAECSESFIAKGAGTKAKMVKRYKASLVDSGRVTIKRAATWTTSTLWDVDWWFRGSAWVRASNGGLPMRNCGAVPKDAQEVVPERAQGVVPSVAGGGPQPGTQFPSEEGDIGAPEGARPEGRAKRAPKEKPTKVEAGFARWKIAHAEYTGEDEDTFVAHLRSGKDGKFVLRCAVDSEEYASIDSALFIDGDPASAVGRMVQMSADRGCPKRFMRAAPLRWTGATLISTDWRGDGSANIRASITEDDREATFALSPQEAEPMAAMCDIDAAGTRVRYRLLPNDTLEFRLVEAA